MKKIVLILFLISIMSFNGVIAGTYASIQISDDTYTDTDNPDSNYGSINPLLLSPTQNLFFKGSLSSVPNEVDVVLAELRMWAPSAGSGNMEAYHVYNKTWKESNITYNNNPCGENYTNASLCNQTYLSRIYGNSNLLVMDVKSAFIYELYNGKNNISIMVNLDSTTKSIYSSEASSSKPTIRIYYYTPIPFITLNSPSNLNYYKQDYGEITFNCSAELSSYRELTNISLYGTWNGGWHNNETKNITGSGISNSTTFTKNITTDGQYYWNCIAYNNESESAFASSNRTFIVDTYNPNISIIYPLNNASDLANDIDIEYNVDDNYDTDYCKYQKDNNGTNVTLSTCQNITSEIWTTSNHTIKIWVVDLAGNENSSTITFTIDNTPPSIDNITIYTTNGSQTINFSLNVSDTHLSSCWYSIFNSTGGIDPATSENTSVSCNSIGNSETVSAYGTYNFTLYANDTVGNEASNTLQFTTSASNGTTIISGGGGSTTIINAEYNWTMEAVEGVARYDIEMSILSKRKFIIEFENLGESARNITLSCEDVIGNACQYVVFPETEITLELAKDTKQLVEFYVEIPSDAPKQDYQFNIVGTDDQGLQRVITTYLGISTLASFSTFVSKIFFSLSSLTLFGWNVPYYAIFFPSIFLAFFIFIKATKDRKVPLRTIWGSILSLTIGVIAVWFV